MFTGGAGSGESEIRKWLLENDWLEANVPLREDVDTYFEREVKPHVPDAWMDRGKDKVGYEINFNRHFYIYSPNATIDDSKIERLFVDRMDQNEDIFVRFMNDAAFQKTVTSWMAEEAYRRLRADPSRGTP